MRGAWISSPNYTDREGNIYYKCSLCGNLQNLDIFDNHMRYCTYCGDYKTIVHRITPPENVTKKW